MSGQIDSICPRVKAGQQTGLFYCIAVNLDLCPRARHVTSPLQCGV